MHDPNRVSATISMILGAFCFALMAAMTTSLADKVSWPVIGSARSLVALVFAVSVARLAGSKLVVLRPRALWLRSLAGGTSLLCNFYAMTHMPLADAVTLLYLHPLWMPFLSWAFFNYRVKWGDLLAVACGMTGVVLIVGPRFSSLGVPTAAALLGSAATAFAMVGLHSVRGVGTWAIVAHFSGVSSIIALSACLFVPPLHPYSELQARSVVVLGGIGLCGAIAQFFMSRAYRKGHPTWVGVVGLSQVAFAAVIDKLVWDRAFSPGMLLGMALILAPSGWLLAGRTGTTAEGDLPADSEPDGVRT
jgi:drug/metabolite transporter (DMT)-like permease